MLSIDVVTRKHKSCQACLQDLLMASVYIFIEEIALSNHIHIKAFVLW